MKNINIEIEKNSLKRKIKDKKKQTGISFYHISETKIINSKVFNFKLTPISFPFLRGHRHDANSYQREREEGADA